MTSAEVLREFMKTQGVHGLICEDFDPYLDEDFDIMYGPHYRDYYEPSKLALINFLMDMVTK